MADSICPALLKLLMMVFSPGIIGQVAWFILIDKRQRRAAICIVSYNAAADGVFMPSCHFGNTRSAFYPLIRPLAIVHFARRSGSHRAGCWGLTQSTLFNLLILLGFILQKSWHALCNISPNE
ncbi:hypothetical protein [Pseudomonas azotoformans]